MGRPRVRGSLALTALVVVACTAPSVTVTSRPPVPEGTQSSAPAGADPIAEPSPLPGPPASASDLPGDLLVRTSGGGLDVLSPDGASDTVIVQGEPGLVQVVTAAWAPDGSRIAWSQLDAEGGAPASRVVWSDPAGGDRQDARIPFPAFYLSWDPTSSRVAFLGGEGPLTLGVIERRNGETAGKPLFEGQPLYFSWAPTGDQLVTHAAEARLDTVTLGREVRALEETGAFQAPVWTPDGMTMLYAAQGQGLVARDVESGKIRRLAPLDGFGFLVSSPDGTRVAFHARGLGETDFYDRELPERATDLGVRVMDVEGGPETVVTDAPAMAWSWSPDGRRLAILEPVYGDTIRFRWVVWDGEGSFATEPFVATVGFQQEAPFFSQYAQSASMWSPDGKAFAYAAEQPDGTPTIWVQPAREGAEPFPVGLGLSVTWSPAAASS